MSLPGSGLISASWNTNGVPSPAVSAGSRNVGAIDASNAIVSWPSAWPRAGAGLVKSASRTSEARAVQGMRRAMSDLPCAGRVRARYPSTSGRVPGERRRIKGAVKPSLSRAEATLSPSGGDRPAGGTLTPGRNLPDSDTALPPKSRCHRGAGGSPREAWGSRSSLERRSEGSPYLGLRSQRAAPRFAWQALQCENPNLTAFVRWNALECARDGHKSGHTLNRGRISASTTCWKLWWAGTGLNRRHQDFQSMRGVRSIRHHPQTSLTIKQIASAEYRESRRSARMVADTFGKVSTKSPS